MDQYPPLVLRRDTADRCCSPPVPQALWLTAIGDRLWLTTALFLGAHASGLAGGNRTADV